MTSGSPASPGLSKKAIGRALAEAGIAYEHCRELGNPKANRVGFAGGPAERAAARARYARLLAEAQASAALDALVEVGRQELVVVLCFEAEQGRRHRDVVLAEARRRASS